MDFKQRYGIQRSAVTITGSFVLDFVVKVVVYIIAIILGIVDFWTNKKCSYLYDSNYRGSGSFTYPT